MNAYDLVILGAGAAGFSAAIRASELGARALLINSPEIGLGGTCVNVGCIPTKYLSHMTRLVHTDPTERVEGLEVSVSIDFGKAMRGMREVIERLRKSKYEDVLANLEGVDFLEGRAKFVSPREVEVEGKRIRGDRFVVCTGSSSAAPPIPGLRETGYLTHIGALRLAERPASLLVVGGGPLGLEMAQIFSRFGTKVYVVEQMPNILPLEEPELSALLRAYLEREEIKIYTNCTVARVWKREPSKFAELSSKEGSEGLEVSEILVATGRSPNTAGLGLEKTDVPVGTHGEIVVNAEMRAGEAIWAAGDVTGPPMLETVAAREGMVAANNALAGEKITMRYDVVPHAVFTHPPLASVGLTDKRAVEAGFACVCNTVPMEYVPRAQAINETRGAVKMVVDNATGRVVGVHILSAQATEMIHEAVMILRNEMTVGDIVETLHVFPTLSEAIKLTAQSFQRDLTKMSCCVE